MRPLFGLAVLLSAGCAAVWAEPVPAARPSAVWVSAPDSWWVTFHQPMDSAATVQAAFDLWQEVFNVRRVYWRGSQVALWLENDHYLVREEYDDVARGVVPWWRHLIDEAGINRLAVEEAHARGMEIWMNDGLFEHGSQADALFFPAHVENRLRVDNPEWVPVDRHGIRRQGGPIEFAYPEARRLLIERYVDHAVRHRYDGIMFYTYVENFSMRYQDEFGFNEPIVAEYRRRHGVDIRTEPFDKTLWAQLRGEYVTQFLRELKQALNRHGKGLGVVIYRRYDDGHYPAKWFACAGNPEISLAGRIYLDWERWVQEGIVDDLMFYGGDEDPAFMEHVFRTADGSGTVLHVSTGANPLAPSLTGYERSGARPCFYATVENAYGPRIAVRDGDIRASDPWVRLRALREVARQRLDAPWEEVAAAAQDANVYVRRAALEALRVLKEPGSVPVLQAALTDPELSVRCAAAAALGPVQSETSFESLIAAARAEENYMLYQALFGALRFYANEHFDDLVRLALDRDAFFLRLACVRLLGTLARSEGVDPLLEVYRTDPDPWVRRTALDGLGRIREPRVLQALLNIAATEKDHDTARRALEKACLFFAEDKALFQEDRQRCLDLAVKTFAQFGGDGGRSDADWGWRALGNAMLRGLGDDGRNVLYEFWKDQDNPERSLLAFRVLFFKQSPMNLNLTTEETALEEYRRAMIEKDLWPWHNPNRLRDH